MRILGVSTVVVAAGLSLAAGAHADSRWYISGDAGGYFREDVSRPETFQKLLFSSPSISTATTSTTTVTVSPHNRPPLPQLVKAGGAVKAAYDPGLVGHIALGYRLTPHLRLEAELGGTAYDRSKIYPYTTDPNFPELKGSAYTRRSGGGFQRFTGEMNAFYDFAPLAHIATPYAGFGLGGWAAKSSTGVYENSGAPFTQNGGRSSSGFGMFEGGVTLKLSPHWSVVPAYRYVHAFNGTGKSTGDVAHIAKIGMRYGF